MVYSNQDCNGKRYKFRRYYLPKGVFKNYNVIINGKNFCDQPIDSDIKPYEETRKSTTGKGEDYNIECLLDYDYIKNRIYRLKKMVIQKQFSKENLMENFKK